MNKQQRSKSDGPKYVDLRGVRCPVIRGIDTIAVQNVGTVAASSDVLRDGRRRGRWVGCCGLRSYMVVRVEKTFEMVHLPEWLRPSARLARQKVLAPRTAFFSRAPPSDLSPPTSASSFNNRQLEPLYSAGDSEAGPEGANPLLKPSSRGPPLRLP